jgi:hypothetical protein
MIITCFIANSWKPINTRGKFTLVHLSVHVEGFLLHLKEMDCIFEVAHGL